MTIFIAALAFLVSVFPTLLWGWWPVGVAISAGVISLTSLGTWLVMRRDRPGDQWGPAFYWHIVTYASLVGISFAGILSILYGS